MGAGAHPHTTPDLAGGEDDREINKKDCAERMVKKTKHEVPYLSQLC
jgi:hypothetical protein